MDSKWESEKWEKAWEESKVMDVTDEVAIESLTDSRKVRHHGQPSERPSKRRKVPEVEGGEVWGEQLGEGSKGADRFLHSELTRGGPKKNVQPQLSCLTGANWMMYELAVEIVKSAACIATDFEQMGEWEEWHVEKDVSADNTELELGLWKELDQLDNAGLQEVKTENTKNKTVKKRGKAAKNHLVKGQSTLDMFIVKFKKNSEKLSQEKYTILEYDDFEVNEYELEKEYRCSLAARLRLPYKAKPLRIEYIPAQGRCDEDNMQSDVQPWCGENDIPTGLVGVECSDEYAEGVCDSMREYWTSGVCADNTRCSGSQSALKNDTI